MILIKHNNEGNLKPYFYFALEEYVMKYLLKEDEAYFFTWKIEGVVIGKNQILENEVNKEYLKANNIEVFRRPTGGGAIYADTKNTMYSMIAKKTENFSFKPYLNLVINALSKLGVNINFSGRNDLLFEEKKISGVAFLQNKYGVLIHGTFMYDVDIKTLVETITPSNEKLISKGISSVRSRVTNLKPYLNNMSLEELITFLETEITDKTYTLKEEDLKMINELALKYESDDWRFKIEPLYKKNISKRISGGNFKLSLEVDKGILKEIKINGDFFELKPISLLEDLLKNSKYEEEDLLKIMTDNKLESIILDINTKEFVDLILDRL